MWAVFDGIFIVHIAPLRVLNLKCKIYHFKQRIQKQGFCWQKP